MTHIQQACTLTGSAGEDSDKRRLKIGALVIDINNELATFKFPPAVQAINQVLQCLKAEGIDSPGDVRYFSYMAFMACKMVRQCDKAHTWLAQAHKQFVMAEGEDSVMAQYLAKLLALPPSTLLTDHDMDTMCAHLPKLGWQTE